MDGLSEPLRLADLRGPRCNLARSLWRPLHIRLFAVKATSVSAQRIQAAVNPSRAGGGMRQDLCSELANILVVTIGAKEVDHPMRACQPFKHSLVG